MVLKPWDQRKRTATTLQPIVQQDTGEDRREKIVAFQPPPLPGTQGLPVQFIIGSTNPFAQPERRRAEIPRRTRGRAACSCSSTRI